MGLRPATQEGHFYTCPIARGIRTPPQSRLSPGGGELAGRYLPGSSSTPASPVSSRSVEASVACVAPSASAVPLS